jgi:ABC-type bacteriocin/lantibiotic exporter with double-glycine peptidase domain
MTSSHAPRRHAECAARSLQLALALLDVELTDEQLMETGLLDGQIHSLAEIEMAAEQFEISSLALQCAPRDIPELELPAIVMLRDPAQSIGHFVVLYRKRSGRIQLLDYPHAPATVDIDALTDEWTGYVLLLANDDRLLAELRLGVSSPRVATRFMLGFVVGTIIVGLVWFAAAATRRRNLSTIAQRRV